MKNMSIYIMYVGMAILYIGMILYVYELFKDKDITIKPKPTPKTFISGIKLTDICIEGYADVESETDSAGLTTYKKKSTGEILFYCIEPGKLKETFRNGRWTGSESN